MFAIVQRPPEKAIVYLDRPQRLGFLPTMAFWNRRDVAKVNVPLFGTFTVLWLLVMISFVDDWVPVWWARSLLVALVPYLFLGALERIIRKRMRARDRLLPGNPHSSSAHSGLQPSPATRLPSSQPSPGPRSPSPQTLRLQSARQPFCGPLFGPLSHASLPLPWSWTRPSPQAACLQARVQSSPLLLSAPSSQASPD